MKRKPLGTLDRGAAAARRLLPTQVLTLTHAQALDYMAIAWYRGYGCAKGEATRALVKSIERRR
jgi:hypothetical protein